MAVFSSLADKLQETFKKLTGKGKLTEADINEAMRTVRMALLEADVSYKVVKDFVAKVKERSLGADILESLTPGQQVIKIVQEELTALMGSENAAVNMAAKPPTIIMMAGLQGSGKTTSVAKIANIYKNKHKRPLLVAADIYRPAAIKQLQVLGEQTDIPVFSLGDKISPVEIARQAVMHAKENGNDMVLIDTAGRLHIDEALMQELKDIKAAVEPNEILLVVDAMAGQDAIKVAETFNAELEIDGLVLTKMDGDTRGGAALSAKAVTGKPIKFVGMGEKLDAMEPFYPDRMASRILGMGDVLTLIEKAQANIDDQRAKELEEKMKNATYTLDDFLDQMAEVRKMGDMKEMLSLIPGLGKKLKDVEIDEREIRKVESIVLSMTAAERQNPSIINASRKQRIAKGSGVQVMQVNRLLKQFDEMKKMMKKLSDNGMMKGNRVHKPRNKKGKSKGGGKKRPSMNSMFSKFFGQ
ncbi:MAG TPA: signal recognition particle protein [Candidatus Avidehalobacter gallistercoris]|uniref:Signal recognition particle protein n=1 Tax=Candidatus Avidehalobacter gallistercoris TaxID=2840694 RepID=A0A9D1HIR4_9FIRM|nr:signal recognition particle protein [Candidatus Avidehalobacter gallistercoris]